MKNHSKESGFALLMTLIVVGVVLSVGMSILDLSIKQVKLSTNAKESEISFHAANAGMECARYWRKESATEMETGQAISPSCFEKLSPDVNTFSAIPAGNVSDPTSVKIGNGDVYLYHYEFTWGVASGIRCTMVDTMVASSSSLGLGVTTTHMTDIFPGWPEATEGNESYCEPGSRCTVLSTRGYNRPCNTANGYGTVQREVLLQF